MTGRGRNNAVRIETEIEKSREDSNWKKVIELAEQLKIRSPNYGKIKVVVGRVPRAKHCVVQCTCYETHYVKCYWSRFMYYFRVSIKFSHWWRKTWELSRGMATDRSQLLEGQARAGRCEILLASGRQWAGEEGRGGSGCSPVAGQIALRQWNVWRQLKELHPGGVAHIDGEAATNVSILLSQIFIVKTTYLTSCSIYDISYIRLYVWLLFSTSLPFWVFYFIFPLVLCISYLNFASMI